MVKLKLIKMCVIKKINLYVVNETTKILTFLTLEQNRIDCREILYSYLINRE